jgi:hypothetical protein
MSFVTPRPVVSGKPYAVLSVHDHIPDGLDDFVGDTSFVLDLEGYAYTVCGPGVRADRGVRVFEKSDDGAGKDVRTWLVCVAADGEAYIATHLGIDVPAQVAQGVLS